MSETTSFWLIRHAAVDGPKGTEGTIWGPSAPADLRDRGSFDLLRTHLPRDAKAYASPAQRTIDTAKALQLDPVLVDEFSEQDGVMTIWLPAAGKPTRDSGAIRPARPRQTGRVLRLKSPGFGKAWTGSSRARPFW